MTPLAGRTAWVFDLDGTLTLPNHDFDAIRRTLGIPEGALILEYLATLPAREAAPLHDRLRRIEAELAARVQGRPGRRALLEQLAARGCPLGILTRNTRDNALASLAALGVDDLFDEAHVLGRDEAAPKPDPDGIHRLLASWAVPPDRAVMVGDFRLDLEAGRNAGVCTVHLEPDGDFAWPELTDVAVTSLDALLERILTEPSP